MNTDCQEARILSPVVIGRGSAVVGEDRALQIPCYTVTVHS